MSERPLFEDNTYPHDRASQYLKLFAHSFDFSRFDLITLLLEWFLFSLWILFLFAKILLLMTWSWQYVFIPFFATLIFGLLRALLCGKRSRCALFVRVVALFFICIFVTFLLLKLENKATFSWHFVLAPLYLLFGLFSVPMRKRESSLRMNITILRVLYAHEYLSLTLSSTIVYHSLHWFLSFSLLSLR
jgi:hypothetical protein